VYCRCPSAHPPGPIARHGAVTWCEPSSSPAASHCAETTLAALVRLIARADEPAGDADRAILTALVATWRRLRRDEALPVVTAIDQLRAFLAPDKDAIDALS
jgi:hypothetical protein